MNADGIVNAICECANSSVDWTQFWPSMIATVVGFFLAIIFQQLIYEAIKDNMFTVSLISKRAIVAEHAMTADTTWIAP